MAIWLGQDGGLRLERAKTEPLFTYIRPSDVDPGAKRFGLDKPVYNLFITGDRLEITRVDEQGNPVSDPLDFISASAWPDNTQYSDATFFCNVDQIGGIRLFRRWSEALANDERDAIDLQTPSADYRLKIRVLQGDERCLAHALVESEH